MDVRTMGVTVEVVAACRIRKKTGHPTIIEPALCTTQAAIIRDAVTGTSQSLDPDPTPGPVSPALF